MLRRSSHWPAKLAVNRRALGSFSSRSTCARKTSGLRSFPLRRQLQQLAVRHGRPEEIRQPRGDGIIVQLGATLLARVIDPLGEEQEMRRAEGGLVAHDHRLGERARPCRGPRGPASRNSATSSRRRAGGRPAGRNDADQPFGVLARLRGSRDERIVDATSRPGAWRAAAGRAVPRLPPSGDRLRLERHVAEEALIAGRRPGAERSLDLDPVHGQARQRRIGVELAVLVNAARTPGDAAATSRRRP